MKLNPKLANAHSHRGFCCGMKGNFDRAMTDLDKAIALNPRYASGYSYRGAIIELRGDQGRAIEDYDQAARVRQRRIELQRYREHTQVALNAPQEHAERKRALIAEICQDAVQLVISEAFRPVRAGEAS
jgi:tetratricopeptide (TPR) repeat protein